jgi:hypothetical protein
MQGDTVKTPAPPTETPVLIVGGGLAGLSSAMFLARQGVRPMLAERHPATSIHPRARGQNPVVMEALRSAGAADAIMAAGPAGRHAMHIVIAESLTGQVFREIIGGEAPDFTEFSPAPFGMASQERAEPILAARARALGADLRFSTVVEEISPDLTRAPASAAPSALSTSSELMAGGAACATGPGSESTAAAPSAHISASCSRPTSRRSWVIASSRSTTCPAAHS